MAEAIYEGLAWIYKMLFTVVIAGIAIGIVSFGVQNDTNTRDVQSNLLLARFLYSPDSMWVIENGRVVPGVIDGELLQKPALLQSRLDAGQHYPVGYGGLRITVLTTDAARNIQPHGPFYVSKESFIILSEQITANKRRSGVYEVHNYPVLIRTAYRDAPAILQVELVVPELA